MPLRIEAPGARLSHPSGRHAVRPGHFTAAAMLPEPDIGADDGRATPELVRVQAELGARLPFREAARVMSVLLPTGKAANHTGIRRRLACTGGSSAGPRRCQPTSDEPRRRRPGSGCPRRGAHSGCCRFSGAPFRSPGWACGNRATTIPALRRCSERFDTKVTHHWQRPAIAGMAARARRHCAE